MQTAVDQPPDAPQIPVVLVGELIAVLVAGAVLSEALRLRTLQETVGPGLRHGVEVLGDDGLHHIKSPTRKHILPVPGVRARQLQSVRS